LLWEFEKSKPEGRCPVRQEGNFRSSMEVGYAGCNVSRRPSQTASSCFLVTLPWEWKSNWAFPSFSTYPYMDAINVSNFLEDKKNIMKEIVNFLWLRYYLDALAMNLIKKREMTFLLPNFVRYYVHGRKSCMQTWMHTYRTDIARGTVLLNFT
jgi:hypothetical protein